MSENKGKLYRFVPLEKVFYNKKIYRIMNSNGLPSYLDISVPMAPNHHFSPIGEVVFFKGHTNVKQSDALEEVHTKLEELESEIYAKDVKDKTTKGKVFWMEAFKIMESKGVNDPSKVLEALNPVDKKAEAKGEAPAKKAEENK